MKARTRIGRVLFLVLIGGLFLWGVERAPAAPERSAAFDPSACDVIIQPGQSIQTAILAAANDQTLCVRGGIYHEILKVPSTLTGLTLIAYNGEAPVIDGQKVLPGNWITNQNLALVEIKGDGTVFDGFEVRFSSGRAIDVNGDNVTVRNTAVHDNWTTGINIKGGDIIRAGILIENNRVYDNLRKVEFAPAIYRGDRSGSGPTDWTFDPDTVWESPFWTGAAADLPESSLYSISMTFNNDGYTSRVYAGSARASINRTGNIGPDYSANGQTIAYSGNDILFHDPTTNKWTLYFDGGAPQSSPRLPAGSVIDAFQIEAVAPPADPSLAPILMSFAETTTVSIAGTPTAIQPGDLVRFTPTAVSPLDEITAGDFTLYRRAAELNLPPAANIDALDRSPAGALLISLTDDTTLGLAVIGKEDLAAYDETSGSWSLFFDGDQIPFNPYSADLTAAWLDAAGNIYISGDPIGGSALAFIETTDSVARGNHVYHNYGEGLVAGRFTERITLEDNVTYDNFHANLYLNSTIDPLVQRNLVYCTDDQAFWRKGSTESYRPAPGIQLRDEVFLDLGTPPPSSGQVIINNIVIGCSVNFGVSTQRPGGGLNDALVANNTFVNARGATTVNINNIELSGDASYANSRFLNNLIVQQPGLGAILRVQGATNMSSLTVANNLYSVTPPGSWFPGEPGRVVDDPQLAGPTSPPIAGAAPYPAAFRLTYDSPAFDAGQTPAEIADDYFGRSRAAAAPFDIGAHELPYEGTILIDQATQPPGNEQAFAYTTDYAPGGFELRDGERNSSGVLAVGVYGVTVAPVAGWTTTATCDDGSMPDAIDLAPGETVTCTFTSVKDAQLVVVNTLTPADATLFDFTLTPGEAIQLGHDSRVFIITPGVAYDLTAVTPDGWRRTAAACDNGAPLDAIVAAPDQTITCTFTHERLGRVVIREQTTPAGASQPFTFTADYDADGFTQRDGESDTSAYLPTGVYTVGATTPTGWAATGATCDDGSLPAAIDLAPGETVTCTFTHEQLGRIVVSKVAVPAGTGQQFAFTADYDPDGFTLGGGETNTSDYLPAGAYAVSENLPPGWVQSGATCDDGSPPAAIDLNPGETVTCTFTNSRTTSGPLATIYITTTAAGTVGGVAYAPGDILAYDGRVNTWSLYFDASDVGLTKALGDFVLLDDGSLLLTVNSKVKLRNAAGALFTLAVQDVARFTPTSLGPTTAGAFEVYFDGSDVGLSTAAEKIDALARRADGTLLISTTGAAIVKNGSTTIKAADEDLLAFAPTTLGGTTAGVWSLAFDGSSLPGMAVEDVTAVWHDAADGTLYLTITNNFTVAGVTGTNRTVLAVTPAGDVSIYWNAADAGFTKLIDGLHIIRE